MTLAMTLVSPHGVWASTDHRLTQHPGGVLITDSSVKHIVTRCPDGAALFSYTGLGRVGSLDVSAWMAEILRGETHTLDETLLDLRAQASARIGAVARAHRIQHAFLAGAFLAGRPWAIEIRNFHPPTRITPARIEPTFSTAAIPADDGLLLVGGAGRDAMLQQDAALLQRLVQKKPRDPKQYMQLLGDVNRRAAEANHPSAKTISRGCTAVYMPPSGDGVQSQWYGPEAEKHLAPAGMSHLLFGIDIGEMARPMAEHFDDLMAGKISEEDFNAKVEAAARRAVEPKGRHANPHGQA